MTRLIRKIEQLFCFCPMQFAVKRIEGNRPRLECLNCGRKTKGVT